MRHVYPTDSALPIGKEYDSTTASANPGPSVTSKSEPESPEDEAASDDKDDEDDVEDEEDADGSSCERLFIMVITAAVILFVAAGVGFQYYVLAFPVEPLED